MHKLAVIGDRDSILGFSAVGLEVYPVSDPAEAASIVRRLARAEYVALFITEQIAKEIPETIEVYKTAPYPAITLIPNNQGSLGLGLQGVRQNVQKAIGADLLFEEKG